jgi:hypothetical protein
VRLGVSAGSPKNQYGEETQKQNDNSYHFSHTLSPFSTSSSLSDLSSFGFGLTSAYPISV